MLWFLLCLCCGLLWVFRQQRKSEQSWLNLPSLQEYRRIHPDLVDEQGALRCCYCHSEQTWEYGFDSVMDVRRETMCLSCHQKLWRTEKYRL